MRSKFQLKEGEVERILNLHKKAILNENKVLKEDKLPLINYNLLNEIGAGGEGDQYIAGGSQTQGFKDAMNSGDENATNSGDENAISKGVNWLSDLLMTYRTEDEINFRNPNRPSTIAFKLPEDTELTFDLERKGATFSDWKSIFKGKISYGFFDCSSGEITLTNILDNTKTTYKSYEKSKINKIKNACKNKGIPAKIDNTSDYEESDDLMSSGYSEDGDFYDGYDRSLTVDCESAPSKGIRCNDRALRLQVDINDFCTDETLNDAIQNQSKGKVKKGTFFKLLEDGMWGPTSKAAWEACKTEVRNHRSGTSGSSGSDGTSGSSGSQGTAGTSGSQIGQTGDEDLALTDAEYVKLTS